MNNNIILENIQSQRSFNLLLTDGKDIYRIGKAKVFFRRRDYGKISHELRVYESVADKSLSQNLMEKGHRQ